MPRLCSLNQPVGSSKYDKRVPTANLQRALGPVTQRYRGELDRYDDDGGTGYHVTYDDGDEEILGMKIEWRDDVRLLPANMDVPGPSEVTKR